MSGDVGWKLVRVLSLITSAAFSGWLLWKLMEWSLR